MERSTLSKGLHFFFKVVNALADFILLFTLGGLFLTVIIQIIGRVIGAPAPWTEEATRYLFLWMMFIALAYGFRFSESARVNVIINLFPKSIKKFFGIIYLVFTIGFFLFITYFGIELVSQQITMHERGAAILIPMAFIGLSVPISGILGVITTIQSIIERPEKIFGGVE